MHIKWLFFLISFFFYLICVCVEIDSMILDLLNKNLQTDWYLHRQTLPVENQIMSSQFSHSVVSDSLWSHGLQHARIPCPSPTTRACSNSYPWSQCCHPTISSCFPLLLLPSIFPSIRVFSNESVLCIRWPKYWSFSFSISPSSECSGLISYRIDRFDLLAESSPTLQFKSINSSTLSFLYSPTLRPIHDYWKNHSFV